MKVEIYGTETCSYCKMAVSLCESKSIEYNYVDVGNSSNLQGLTDRMGVRPRQVPQIFLNGDYVPGGYTGLQNKLAKG